jgi:hypothetical protein
MLDRPTFDALVRETFDPDDADPGTQVLYAAALDTLDELDRIQAELAGATLSVTTTQGVARSHPLLDQAIRHRIALGKLCAALFADPGKTARSARGRAAANARWKVG